ncbi:hypothetical protein HHK36_023450 [Tetracentron sinense]|uniref:eIF-4F 25 kDa subunit n=1 Tax=Tetracentron sinense TaxID=13715 RepID=A0A834YLF8_TETSI|nr:hypothetical protein HHK36_023450 [Tetracentron sinense]
MLFEKPRRETEKEREEEAEVMSATAEEEIYSKKVVSEEEKETVGGNESSSLNPMAAIAHQAHPLEHSWTFWEHDPPAKSKPAAWGSSIRALHTFATAEEFSGYIIPFIPSLFTSFFRMEGKQKALHWNIWMFDRDEELFWGSVIVYNHIYHPTKFVVGADFYCFKYKIEPKWEDPVCANGGKWTIRFARGKSDTCWLYTLLAMIGEQFDYGDEICGAVVNFRSRHEKITLWTKNASNEAAQVTAFIQIIQCMFC